MVKKIEIRMLGGFSVTADGKPIAPEGTKLTKPWQLFCYLALRREDIVTSEELMETLWNSAELADPANVLKNTVYALRREIAGSVKPGESPIVYRAGGYCLNTKVKFVIDVDRFADLCGKAKRSKNDIARREAYAKAEASFTGDLLPMAENEAWVTQFARNYKQKYVECAHGYCACLEAVQDWKTLLSVSTRATLVDPLDEPCVIYTFRALAQLQMPRAIVMTYSKTARYFEEELGTPLCEEVRRIYSAAAEKVNKTDQDMMLIREDMMEIGRSQRPLKGAFYCSYEVMKRMYPLVARGAERNGQTVMMILATLLDLRGHVPMPAALKPAMIELKLAVSASLRRSDTFARYSKNQYVVMLPWERGAGLEPILGRIQEVFGRTPAAQKVQLDYKISQLE